MALQKDFNLKGIDITQAYFVITGIRYEKVRNDRVTFDVSIFQSKEMREDSYSNMLTNERYSFNFSTFKNRLENEVENGDITEEEMTDILTGDSISMCYEYLKRLDGFGDAIDILEDGVEEEIVDDTTEEVTDA